MCTYIYTYMYIYIHNRRYTHKLLLILSLESGVLTDTSVKAQINV